MKKIAAFISIVGMLLYGTTCVALSISHGSETLTPSGLNFTFAKSIWVNNDSHSNFRGSGIVNYLFIDDIKVSGSFQLSSPLSQSDAQISLYRLEGLLGNYTSVLVKTWSGAHMVGHYYIEQPGAYLIEAVYPSEIYPHITFDFFPDNTSGLCRHLAPSSSFSCDESWLPAHYRKEVEPWIRAQVEEIRAGLGLVVEEKRVADFEYFLIDSSIDAAFASVSPGGVVLKKTGQAVRAKLGWEESSLGFAIDQGVQHGIVISSLFISGWNPLDPSFYTAWAGAVQQLAADGQSIWSNATGVFDLDILEEKFNETKIAWTMLETFILNNYGDWDSLAIRAGLDPVDSPSTYEIIEGIAASLGYVNHWYDKAYDLESVNRLFNEGATEGFGDWVFLRKSLDNPLDDVDGDGFKNRDDSAPNDPMVPSPVVIEGVNTNPIAKFAVGTPSFIVIGNQVSLTSDSSDIESPTLVLSWVLSPPSGSASSLSSITASTVSFTPDVSGDYTVRLTVDDGDGGISFIEKNISAQVVAAYLPEVFVNDSGHIDGMVGSVSACIVKYIGTYTVPNGEKWTSIKFAASQSDIVVLVDDDEVPSNKGTYPCPSYAQNFDSDEEYDYFPSTKIYAWTKDLFPGDQLRIAVFSYEGDAYSVNIDVAVDYDLDGDGVDDHLEDSACLNNSTDWYDTDGDLVCDNADRFPNDIAASVDSDGDGYPDAWNSGRNENDSSTGLVLDAPNFISVSTEWADSDGDGIGNNVDKFDTDVAASTDSDNDGSPDSWNVGKDGADSTTGLHIDKFPNDWAASIDDDGDLHPEVWNPLRSAADSTTGLTLDVFPNNISEWADSDLDGVGDNSDWAPTDYSEWLDSDSDGVGDNADPAPNDDSRLTNISPVISGIANREVMVGNQVSFNLSVTDADNDELSIQLINAPTFITLSNAEVSLNPAIQDVGVYTVIVRADDGFGGVFTTQFVVSVPHTLNIISGPTRLIENGYNEMSVSVVDTAGHDLNYFWEASCSGLANGGSFAPDNMFEAPDWIAPTLGAGESSLCTITVTINDGIDGLSDASSVGIRIGSAVQDDFNGDGKADILLYSSSLQRLFAFEMDGASILTSKGVANIPNWSIVDKSNDFNGDGKADILLRHNTNHALNIFLMDGSIVSSSKGIAKIPGWSISGIADFNGDNKADILLQNDSTGIVIMFLMNGNVIQSSSGIAKVPDWTVAATGDHNGDGKADILLYGPASHKLHLFTMDGTNIAASKGVANIGAWTVSNVSDYTADSKADILLYHPTLDKLHLYTMNGSTISASTAADSLVGHTLEGHTDLDGDKKTDLLVRDSTNKLHAWMKDGATTIDTGILSPVSGWSIADLTDYDGDADNDVLLQHDTNYTLHMLRTDGKAVIQSKPVGKPTGWRAVD